MLLASEIVVDTNRTQQEYNTIKDNLRNFKQLIKSTRFTNTLPYPQLELAGRLVDALLEFTGVLETNRLQWVMDNPSQSADRHPKSVIRASNGLSAHINYDSLEETKCTLLDHIERMSRACAKMNDGSDLNEQTRLVNGFIRNLIVKNEGCMEQRMGKSILFVETGTYDLLKAVLEFTDNKTEDEFTNPRNIIGYFYDLVNCKAQAEYSDEDRVSHISELSWALIKTFIGGYAEDKDALHDRWISFHSDLPVPDITNASGQVDNYQFSTEQDALCYLGYVKSIIPDAVDLDKAEVADTRGQINAQKPYGFTLSRVQKNAFDQKITTEQSRIAIKLKDSANQSVIDLGRHSNSKIDSFLIKMRQELQKLNPSLKKMQLLNKILNLVKDVFDCNNESLLLQYSAELNQMAKEILKNSSSFIDHGIANELTDYANLLATERFNAVMKTLKTSFLQNSLNTIMSTLKSSVLQFPLTRQSLIDAAAELATSLQTELTNKGGDLDSTLLLTETLNKLNFAIANKDAKKDAEFAKSLKEQAEKVAACSAIDSEIAKGLLNCGIILANIRATAEIAALKLASQNQNLQLSLPELAKNIDELITEIENDLEASKENLDNTLVLVETLTIVKKAVKNKDSNLHSFHILKVEEQAEKVSGASSFGWKLAGILTIIAGILIAAVAGTAATVLAIASTAATFGLAAPISVPIAAGIGAGGGTAGAFLTGLGMSFFYYGRQKGVSSQLTNLAENLKGKTYTTVVSGNNLTDDDDSKSHTDNNSQSDDDDSKSHTDNNSQSDDESSYSSTASI